MKNLIKIDDLTVTEIDEYSLKNLQKYNLLHIG